MSDFSQEDQPPSTRRAMRYGLELFLFYFLLYAGFILLNLFAPDYIAEGFVPPDSDRGIDLHGLNLALVYGLLLILIAIFLAFYHLRRCPPSAGPKTPGRAGG
ncbi:MAG: hypothetical protein FWD61_06025 [Phycisphaerales bacterium]|nr:hypothetical protein [Phycisphaerales bacterium]